jgi:hypothetical protein
MTKSEDAQGAARDIERIRALMERATEFSNLSGWSILISGALAVAGVAACRYAGVDFREEISRNGEYGPAGAALGPIWGSVFVLAVVQGMGFSVANSRRKAEPFWSPLTRQVVVAMLPALFTGAALTEHALRSGRLEILPPCWMLAYGSSLMGLGLFAGRAFRVAALAFLVLGALSLFLLRSHGLIMMLVSFGGLHLLLGAWVLWKRRA